MQIADITSIPHSSLGLWRIIVMVLQTYKIHTYPKPTLLPVRITGNAIAYITIKDKKRRTYYSVWVEIKQLYFFFGWRFVGKGRKKSRHDRKGKVNFLCDQTARWKNTKIITKIDLYMLVLIFLTRCSSKTGTMCVWRDQLLTQRVQSAASSCESMKSDRSRDRPPVFKAGLMASEFR